MNKILNVEKKKGDDRLNGQITVYAKIDMDPAELLTMNHPAISMVHGGLLAVQGNYREQNSLRDFLRTEMGITFDSNRSQFDAGNDVEDGLKEMIEGLDGIESALDPQKLREKLENMDEIIEEFIPTPAKMMPFHTEQEILAQPGDIYFAGFYKKVGNAVLAVNAVPILYQALFKEQQTQSLQSEIESIISQIEYGEPAVSVTVTTPGIDPEETLLKEYFPTMLYQKVDPKGFAAAQRQFRMFMTGYRFRDDVEAIISLISGDWGAPSSEFKLLELYAKKIALVQTEDFAGADVVCREIDLLKNA